MLKKKMGFIACTEHSICFNLSRVAFDIRVFLSFIVRGALSLAVRTKIT